MRAQYLLVIPVAILFVFGVVMIFNTTSAEILDCSLSQNAHYPFMRQLLYGTLGVIGAALCYQWGFRRLLQAAPELLALLSLLLIAVFIPGLGIMANGSRRWVGMAGWSVQPSEVVKYVLPLFVIGKLPELRARLCWKTILKVFAILCIPLGLILLEPNNGTLAVMGCTLMVVAFLSGIPARFWAIPAAAVLAIASAFACTLPYAQARIQNYLHPERDIMGKGHQPYQAKVASGSGGVWGKGPGKSLQKLSYLPESQNDYIGAIFAEEYGFFGVMLLVALYGWLTLLGVSIAMRARDDLALYAAAAITFLLGFQAFLNLGVVSGLLPSTGLNLPFFSQGGSSLMANMAAVGLLMDIARESDARVEAAA